MESTKQSSNEAENGNKSKPMLAVVLLLKHYEVVEVSEQDSYRESFSIIDDKGNRRSYFCKNSQFSAV